MTHPAWCKSEESHDGDCATATELVELRAEVERLRTLAEVALNGWQHSASWQSEIDTIEQLRSGLHKSVEKP